jgi:D-glycero-alpha-D-manno-heptose-7-phosphate kinase
VTGQSLPRHGLAELAHALEVEELKIECGVQDQYAAAFGGVHFMEIEYPRVRLSPLDLSRDFVDELNERLLLVYSGESRLSGQVHTRVIRNYRGQEGTEQEAMQTLRDCAYRMKDALLAEDFDAVADVMNTNWEAQKALHEGITTDRIEETITVARQAGASGAKVNGAGGGGSLTLLCKPGAEFSVRRAVSQVEGVSLLPCSISFGGVRAWDVSDV